MSRDIIYLLRLFLLDKVKRIRLSNLLNTANLILKDDSKKLVRSLNHLRPKRSTNILRILGQLFNHRSNSSPILSIQIRIQLIQTVKRRRITLLNRENQCKCTQRFLPPTELLNPLLFIVLRVEGYTDGDTNVILHSLTIVCVEEVVFSLDDETTGSGGDEFFKDFGKVFGDLFEGSFDDFVFALVEDFDEFADGFLGGFEFCATGS